MRYVRPGKCTAPSIAGKRLMVAPERLAVQRRRIIDRENSRAESSFQKRPDLARREAASAATACCAAARINRIWMKDYLPTRAYACS
jgi:hypothetical protein